MNAIPLACPICRFVLQIEHDLYRCQQCGRTYASIFGIPSLGADDVPLGPAEQGLVDKLSAMYSTATGVRMREVIQRRNPIASWNRLMEAIERGAGP